MNCKPILFSTPMVQAILDGRKTQTRRVVTPQPDSIEPYKENRLPIAFWVNYNKWVKPKYQPGDILWVRETWRRFNESLECPCYEDCNCPENGTILYYADSPCNESKWKPSTHMPRSAARIFLKVTDVRVERVQNITEDDAITEGFGSIGGFREYWDMLSTKARGSDWYTNEWVWVYEFERVESE